MWNYDDPTGTLHKCHVINIYMHHWHAYRIIVWMALYKITKKNKKNGVPLDNDNESKHAEKKRRAALIHDKTSNNNDCYYHVLLLFVFILDFRLFFFSLSLSLFLCVSKSNKRMDFVFIFHVICRFKAVWTFSPLNFCVLRSNGMVTIATRATSSYIVNNMLFLLLLISSGQSTAVWWTVKFHLFCHIECTLNCWNVQLMYTCIDSIRKSDRWSNPNNKRKIYIYICIILKLGVISSADGTVLVLLRKFCIFPND